MKRAKAGVLCRFLVVVAVFGSVLVPAVSAHDSVHEPLTETRTVDVYNYEDQEVRVAPFTEARTVAVFNYEDRQVRVAPFVQVDLVDVYNYETRQVRVAPFTETLTIPAYNFEDQRVRVAPFTQTRTVARYNYEDQRVRVAPFTQTTTVAVFNYETRQVRVAPFRQRVTVQPPCEWVTVYGQRVYYCPPPRTTWQAVYNYQTQSVRVAPFTETRNVAVFNYQTRRVRVAPFREILTIPAYNYETRSVRVAPFTQTRTVARYNYEDQQVRVAPFTEARSVDVFYYETRQVRVAPFTETQSVDVFNYETQPVRVAPFTETVTVTDPDPEKGTWRHDPSEHTCPDGQYMAPFPEMWLTAYSKAVYEDGRRTGREWQVTFYTTRPAYPLHDDAQLVTEWVEQDSHTGCHSPNNPYAGTTPPPRRSAWDRVSSLFKSALEATIHDAGFVIEPATSWAAENSFTAGLYESVFITVCAPEDGTIAQRLTALGLSAAGASRTAWVLSKAQDLGDAIRRLSAVTVGGVVVNVVTHIFCEAAVDPTATTSSSTTTTTTTLPPEDTDEDTDE